MSRGITLRDEDAGRGGFTSPWNAGVVAGVAGSGAVDLQTAGPRCPVGLVTVQADVDGATAGRFTAVHERFPVMEPDERSATTHHLLKNERNQSIIE